MATNPPPIPPQPPTINQQYQPPTGAIPIERIKRVGIILAIAIVGILTIWGSLHKPQPLPAPKAANIVPTTAAEVDSQQSELDRLKADAERAAEEAALAKARAQHAGSVVDQGPHNAAQLDPAQQLEMQFKLDEMRRRHQAAFTSTVAFAQQRKEENEGTAPSVTPVSTRTESPDAEEKPEEKRSAVHEPEPLPPDTYLLDEGTVIETMLLNRLNGELVGPVIAQISLDVYSKSGLALLIPKGSRVLGEAKAVSSLDQQRLEVMFHRVILPNGVWISLDKARGLDQIGETGLVSNVNHHYMQIFGVSAALGLIGGLTEIGNSAGIGYNPITGFRAGATERMGESAEQVLAKYLNRLPTITVREGSRIKILLTQDLEIKAYE